jgi:small-conductance mechanosensitive channel
MNFEKAKFDNDNERILASESVAHEFIPNKQFENLDKEIIEDRITWDKDFKKDFEIKNLLLEIEHKAELDNNDKASEIYESDAYRKLEYIRARLKNKLKRLKNEFEKLNKDNTVAGNLLNLANNYPKSMTIDEATNLTKTREHLAHLEDKINAITLDIKTIEEEMKNSFNSIPNRNYKHN